MSANMSARRLKRPGKNKTNTGFDDEDDNDGDDDDDDDDDDGVPALSHPFPEI